MKTVIYWGAVFILLSLLAYQSLIAWDVRNVQGFQHAYGQFVKDAATSGCVTRSSIIQAAEVREWEFEDDRQSPFRSSSPKEWSVAVRVFTVPPLNFSKEPGVMFFFDERDCMIGKW